MEKLMVLKEVSGLKQNTVNGRDGQQQVIESFDVVLSDGIDTVMAETSKSVTVQFKNQAPAIDKVYGASVRLNVVEYEKDGKKSRFFKAVLLDCRPV